MNVQLRALRENDAVPISQAFKEQGWDKPASIYQSYWKENCSGERETIVAEVNGNFAGYVNVVWQSYYPAFRESNIPEIHDFNVLQKCQRMGIGTRLMDYAEQMILERSPLAGLGVGIFSNYGAAQVLYVKRGYVPDGRGIHDGQRYIQNGDLITVDDDIVLYFIKRLRA